MDTADQANEAGGASRITALNNNNHGISASPKRLHSKRELAVLFGVSQRTVDNWVAQKRIPRLRLSARLTRFNLARVEAALARFEVKEVGARQ